MSILKMNVSQSAPQRLVYRDHNGAEVVSESVKSPSTEDFVDGHCYLMGDYKVGPIEYVNFQNGPIPANGINGWTNEQLLACLIDRTEILNAKFHSEANDRAIASMKDALQAFEERTKERQKRGVEGKEIK